MADFRDNLVKTWISPSLVRDLVPLPDDAQVHVIIAVNTSYPGGTRAARWLLVRNYRRNHPEGSGGRAVLPEPVIALPDDLVRIWDEQRFSEADRVNVKKSAFTDAYLFASLSPATINRLLEDCDGPVPSPIHKFWRDDETQPFIYASARTVKCDAARIAFSADGQSIVWAVVDTGIDASHPHFNLYQNLDLSGERIRHYDFTFQDEVDDDKSERSACTDSAGHGTHVAGIIAGRTLTKRGSAAVGPTARRPTFKIVIDRQVRKSFFDPPVAVPGEQPPEEVAGLAMRCRLLSLKVMEGKQGRSSDVIAALGYIQQINNNGRELKVHGVNLSVGYPFDPEWFAAGQSPLCVEVDRLVRSGVAVVVAAGNLQGGNAGRSETIADPGNARLAITVGSTHRNEPHTFGVSYFSAKGPTSDGRSKPDLVAPGERIVSCQAGPAAKGEARFKEDTGTSMAAPHVSGVIAGLLSVRREFIGQPEAVKDLLTRSAVDLGRQPEYQGAGLVDMMRALQAI